MSKDQVAPVPHSQGSNRQEEKVVVIGDWGQEGAYSHQPGQVREHKLRRLCTAVDAEANPGDNRHKYTGSADDPRDSGKPCAFPKVPPVNAERVGAGMNGDVVALHEGPGGGNMLQGVRVIC